MPRGIKEAQERLTEIVMAIPGVVGTAIGENEGEPCLKVFVTRRDEVLTERIPAEYEGHRVVLQETGVIRKRDSL